jgi:hypothetical protein
MGHVSRGALLAVALAAFASPGQRPSEDEPYPLTVEVGKSVAVCSLGAILCPANNAFCEDPSVAAAAIDAAQGLLFKGVKPGVTTCSAASGSGLGFRRVFRVTVTAATKGA